jgi:hypothetical protein
MLFFCCSLSHEFFFQRKKQQSQHQRSTTLSLKENVRRCLTCLQYSLHSAFPPHSCFLLCLCLPPPLLRAITFHVLKGNRVIEVKGVTARCFRVARVLFFFLSSLLFCFPCTHTNTDTHRRKETRRHLLSLLPPLRSCHKQG